MGCDLFSGVQKNGSIRAVAIGRLLSIGLVLMETTTMMLRGEEAKKHAAGWEDVACDRAGHGWGACM